MDIFERRVGKNTVADIVFGPMQSNNITPVVVDAGARNGMLLSKEYAKRSRMIGFEPNLEEYEKLVARNTDAMKAGMPMAHFQSEKYHNCALWDNEEERPFYITVGAGACTLMGEADRSITERMWLDNKLGRTKSYADIHTQVKKTAPVLCRRLDDVLNEGSVIDYLKLDVEGAEMAILRGASRLFDQKCVLLIKTEFVFTPYYKVHPIFGYQHVFLHEKGYRLINMDFQQSRYSRDRTRIPSYVDRRMIYAGDAYFALDPDKQTLDPIVLYRMGVISLALGFSSFGVSLLRDSKLIDPSLLDSVETSLGHARWKRKWLHHWNQIPYRVAALFRLT